MCLQKVFKKGGKWGTAEIKTLLSKGFEFIDVVEDNRKDTATMEVKQKIWKLVATQVNGVNLTKTIRTWKDCSAKWSQLKCKAKGDMDALKKSIKMGVER